MNSLDDQISLKVFISYSHEDLKYLQELEKHLSLLKRTEVISVWTDRCIPAGGTWEDKLDSQLEDADVIIFLITPSFLASNYCYDKELQIAIKQHKHGEASLFPIVVRPVDWENSVFSKYQILPRNGKPIIKWKSRDDGWLNITKEIREFLENHKTSLLNKKIETYIKEKSNISTKVSPPFLLNDFNPVSSIKIKHNENNAPIPCKFEKDMHSNSIRIIFNTLIKYFEQRSEILYQHHLDLWDRSEERADGSSISYPEERLERYEQLKKENKGYVKPLMLLISGETGAGKSTLINDLANIFHCNIVNLESDIDSSMLFINYLKSKLPNSKSKKRHHEKEKIVLFDAFEKIRPGSTRKEIKEQIKTIEEVSDDYQCVIISVRSNFLLNYNDEGFSKYKLIELLPLEIDSVKQIADRISGNDKFYKLIDSSDTLKEISKKPLLLSLLIEVYKDNQELSLVDSRLDLFDYVVDKWLVRDENYSPINAKSRLIITKRLAINCLNLGKTNFSYDEINLAIKEQYSDLSEISLERYNNALRNCSFIRKNNSGNFEFQHAAFLEYCIARAIIDDLILNNYDSFSWAAFNPEIIETIHDLLSKFNLKSTVINSIEKAYIDSKDSRKSTNLLKLANKLGKKRMSLDGINLQNEILYGIDFSNREVLNATFENCDFAGANLSYLTARNWKIKDCVFKKCQLHNVKVNSPQIYDSIISISSNEDMHLNFADCSQLELSIDYTGLIEFTGGRLNGGVIETKNYTPDIDIRPKKSSIKFAELERVLFSECAAGFYVGFCSVDELTLYSLYNLERDSKASLSEDIERSCEQWKGGGIKVKKLISPFVRVDDKPVNPIEQCLSKTKMKKYRRRAEKVKAKKDN